MEHDESIESRFTRRQVTRPAEFGEYGSTPPMAAQMGLASSLIGIAVFLAAPAVAIMAAQIWAHGDRGRGGVLLHAWLARIAVCIPIVMVFFGVYLGVAGMRQALRERSSVALPLSGLVLSASGFGGWILAAIGLLNVTESMLRLFG